MELLLVLALLHHYHEANLCNEGAMLFLVHVQSNCNPCPNQVHVCAHVFFHEGQSEKASLTSQLLAGWPAG